MTNKLIVVPILNDRYKVQVCLGDEKFFRKALKKSNYTGLIDGYLKYAGVTFYCPHGMSIIWIKEVKKTPQFIGVLAHEACHAIHYLFKYIKQDSVCEVYCHSVEAVVRIVLEKLKDKK